MKKFLLLTLSMIFFFSAPIAWAQQSTISSPSTPLEGLPPEFTQSHAPIEEGGTGIEGDDSGAPRPLLTSAPENQALDQQNTAE